MDDRKLSAQPDISCIQMEEVKCNCYSEQMTHLEVNFKMCSTIAKEGIYNPYRRPIDHLQEQPRFEQEERVRLSFSAQMQATAQMTRGQGVK